jgi:hypothetical protein
LLSIPKSESRQGHPLKKDLYKLASNAIFGKSMESLRNRINVKLVNNEKEFLKLVAKPTFQNYTIVNENLVMVKIQKEKLLQNKPMYTGFTVLELSKVLMYKFHYEKILPRYSPDKARLLFTDTDSLRYHIQTDDIYEDMQQNLDYYDTSGYPPTHPLYSPKNAKVLGKFKDETNGDHPVEFVGLRSKMYSLLA